MKQSILAICIAMTMLPITSAYAASNEALFVKYSSGILTEVSCDNYIPTDRCGYFVDNVHLNLSSPVPNELQNKLAELSGKVVCVGVGSESDELVSLEAGSCD